ncbi:unnamed protein product [Mytilus coruscus]|uniref:Uncharacterized protein n=1 Tax=Mytilus coruscus TaxID=42192 RepID=A0A6J8C8Z6_MYTCO|nr:unnamed protein product [Mytilus coruscus]
MYDKAFASFVESISEELFVHKMVFSLSYLLSKYKSFLPEDVSSKYTSYRLQLRLKNHFREHIVVDVNHGQGESNFVYSSSLTLPEAVRTAIRFKAETKFTKLQMSACTSKNDQTDENQILYSAASILRREIKNAVVPMDTYPSVDEMSLSKSLETVPSVLTGFINWLIDDSHSQVDIKNHLSDIPFEKTVDGKDTFHSMARAVFQVCEEINGETEHLEHQKVARGRIKTLPIDEKVFSLTTCAPFTKPKQRAEPSRKSDVYSKLSACVLPYAETSDLIWVLLRNLSRTIVDLPYKQPSFEGQQIPFWTGFNKQISNISTTYHVVSYPPIIDAKPSDMGTVYTTMKRCADMCQKAGQPFSIQTFDLQLYAVAQQVKWDRPSEFKSHILRLGGFHTLSCFISSIGKIWGDGGLRDLLVDSGVYAAATVDQMLSGKQFNRAVRGLTLLYETLKTLWICSFFVWIRQQKCLEIPESIFAGLTECHESFTSNGRTFDMLQSLEKALNDDLGSKMNEFREWGGHVSPTFRYWDMLLQALEIMLINIRAERNGLWSLHLHSIFSMLPYFFVTNKNNYSRWTPVYLLDMLNLPTEAEGLFSMGFFSVRQKVGSFNGVWSDMATEKTVIKDSKGDGGIVGLTRKKASLIRWNLTRHVLSQITSAMRARACLVQVDDQCHDEAKPAAMKRDEKHVQDLIVYITENMTNPFDVDNHPRQLINISTGLHASHDIEDSLLKSVETGRTKMKIFVESSLSTDKAGSFYHPIQRSGLKTFEDMNPKVQLKCKSGQVVKGHLKSELVFRRALSLTKCRDDVLWKLFCPIQFVPFPLHYFMTMEL